MYVLDVMNSFHDFTAKYRKAAEAGHVLYRLAAAKAFTNGCSRHKSSISLQPYCSSWYYSMACQISMLYLAELLLHKMYIYEVYTVFSID